VLCAGEIDWVKVPNATIDACAPGGAAPFAIEWTYGDRTKFAAGDVLVLQLRNRLSGFPVRVDAVPTSPTPLVYPATSASVVFPHPIPATWGLGKLVMQPLLWLQKANNASINSEPAFSAGSVTLVCSCAAGDEDCACAPTCGGGLTCLEGKACVRLYKECSMTSECTARGTVARQCVAGRCVASSCPSVAGVAPSALGCVCSSDTRLSATARCAEGGMCDAAGANGGVCVAAPPTTSSSAVASTTTAISPMSTDVTAQCSYYKRFCPVAGDECAPDGPDHAWVCGPKRTCATLGCASGTRCYPVNGWGLMDCVPLFPPSTAGGIGESGTLTPPAPTTAAPPDACAMIKSDIAAECANSTKVVSENYTLLLMAANIGVKSDVTQTRCANLRDTRVCYGNVLARHAACGMPWSASVMSNNNDLRSTLPACKPAIAELLAQIDCDICAPLPAMTSSAAFAALAVSAAWCAIVLAL
jgi:hypothetical protein